MKVWMLYTHHYNFCDQWDTILGIFGSEDKAVLAQIAEEGEQKYDRRSFGEQTDWTSITEGIVQ